jgi:hypothetical protein
VKRWRIDGFADANPKKVPPVKQNSKAPPKTGPAAAVQGNARRTLYVATNGNDRNPGTKAQPFQHIGKGVSVAKPGDVICVDDGEYPESISFPRSGTADAWITLRARNMVDVYQARPLVKIAPRSGGTAVGLRGQSYLRVEGFEISGGLWGINSSGKGEHHTVITNNLVHDVEASGIQLNDGDYRTITKNIVHDCAKKWKGSGSGISIYTPAVVDERPGFHNVIAQNICYGNSNPPGGTDGNGIIFDDGRHSQSDKKPYTPATLIENNLAYFNGGAGIQVYRSSNVTVRKGKCKHLEVTYAQALGLVSYTSRGVPGASRRPPGHSLS